LESLVKFEGGNEPIPPGRLKKGLLGKEPGQRVTSWEIYN